jgi:short subunit dehydrogenase-like uncharacterized protein
MRVALCPESSAEHEVQPSGVKTDIGGRRRILLYGAYGFTGRLTAELATARGANVVLAGRDAKALQALGSRLRMPTRVVGLDDVGEISRALADVSCVLHMAGPFATTSAPMLDACIATRTNYVDITGEIEVFEALWSRATEIERAGITAVPGAGFDVVPTDCLAAYVASKMASPTALTLALRGMEHASRGTLRTAIRQLSKPALCRRAGVIVRLDDRSVRKIDFGSGPESCVPISWGDVATAFHTTGVGDVTVYIRRTRLLRVANIAGKVFGSTLRSQRSQKALKAIVQHFPDGPAAAERVTQRSTIWAEARDTWGKTFRAVLSTPNAYDFAASSALQISTRLGLLQAPLGVVTPAQAFGADFVLSLPGCERFDVQP